MECNFSKRDVSLATVTADASLIEVAEKLINSQGDLVIVQKGEGVQGYIDHKSIIKWFLKEGDKAAQIKAGDIAVEIKEKDKLPEKIDIESIVERLKQREGHLLLTNEKGEVIRGLSFMDVIDQLSAFHKQERHERIKAKRLAKNTILFTHLMIDMLPFGVILVSRERGKIVKCNRLAKKILSENFSNYDEITALINGVYKDKVIESKSGAYYRMEVNSLDKKTNNILVAFIDVSREYTLLNQIKEIQEEVETAFLAMLPDQRIEARLKSIPEYMDEYDENTGMIKITGIIEDGCYRHVVNMLKLLADTFKQGLMELPGMNKNTLVQATILHDIGKVQPDLKVGDVVNPKEVFEQGFYHAFRGASLSRSLYDINDEVYYLIRYHHHAENELPADFPDYLLVMHRFFRLIDGLSAGITRRGSKVKMKIKGTKILVREQSNFPSYNQEIEMDIYTGRVIRRDIE
ncbi:HD domain-containing protein [Caldicoprobacter algeriensis]|uniref:HD domain-containing protein n=1 Tax=Caldicoprobacter algeriensis TaxID=699281 RepID=UPI00207A49BB|nr:HD domain-containing protein [Caldicoprobacter algeriensis]MCM8900742.1 HD domain-containing protein [Caldicoprobacter algeriensis]